MITKKSGFFLTTFLISLFTQAVFAYKIDTAYVKSSAMNKEIPVLVIKPDTYSSSKDAFNSVYLLHGYSDNFKSYITKGDNAYLADLFQVVIICPDGGFSSWYWNSPVDPSYKYETFVADELIKWANDNLNVKKQREGRAITGLSMGGHGALYLSIRHQDVFGAAGSMSGGVDINPFPNNWDMAKRLGTKSENPEIWADYSVMGQLHLLSNDNLKLIIDCGYSDFFYQVNLALHDRLSYLNVPHDFIVRPGHHNWPYWQNAIKYQFMFFSEYFKNGK